MLTAKSSELAHQPTWLASSLTERDNIKRGVLRALASTQQSARHLAAQVIGAIAVVELPNTPWPELIPLLAQNIEVSGNDDLKQSSLEALGFVCEGIGPSVLDTTTTNSILTSVVRGMRKEEPNINVRLAGVLAMYKALFLAKESFQFEDKRMVVMQTIYDAVLVENADMKHAATQCIVRIAELYYDKVGRWMPALYECTLAALQKVSKSKDRSDEAVGKLALDFWRTISKVEAAIEDKVEESKITSHGAIKHWAGQLVEVLLEVMCNEELTNSAAECLALFAVSVPDQIVGRVFEFFKESVEVVASSRASAATVAWGCLLEVASNEALQPYMVRALEMMISLLGTDTATTAAWAIGSIQPQHWDAMLREGHDSSSEGFLLGAMKNHIDLAERVCLAVHIFANQHVQEQVHDYHSNWPSGLLMTLANVLLDCTKRHHEGTRKLSVLAYGALNMVIENAAEEMDVEMGRLLTCILSRLEDSLAPQMVSDEAKEVQRELRGLLCKTLQVIQQKLGVRMEAHHAAQMTNLIARFEGATDIEHAAQGKKVSGKKEGEMRTQAPVAASAEANAGKLVEQVPRTTHRPCDEHEFDASVTPSLAILSTLPGGGQHCKGTPAEGIEFARCLFVGHTKQLLTIINVEARGSSAPLALAA